MITINGEKITNTDKVSIYDYLLKNNYDVKRVAVEINGNIIPKAQYEERTFDDGDSVEIVSFVGGG